MLNTILYDHQVTTIIRALPGSLEGHTPGYPFSLYKLLGLCSHDGSSCFQAAGLSHHDPVLAVCVLRPAPAHFLCACIPWSSCSLAPVLVPVLFTHECNLQLPCPGAATTRTPHLTNSHIHAGSPVTATHGT